MTSQLFSDTIYQVYTLLRSRLGHLPRRHAEIFLKVCMGAVFTQKINAKNVEKAIWNLKEHGCLEMVSIMVAARMGKSDHRLLLPDYDQVPLSCLLFVA